jgi:Fe2+ transport system protein FeoA
MRLISRSRNACALSTLEAGVQATVWRVDRHKRGTDRADRLAALGVTAGAAITVLQVCPGIVFLCDQTEIAVERDVADSILVTVSESGKSRSRP